MLREVYQLWKSEILDDQGEVVEEGRQVLITDNSLLDDPEYTGVGIRDGRLAGRRISTAVYSFDNPLDCVGVFDLENELTASYTIGYDDPLNPYKHKFHPDHDNLDRDFQDPREEAYEISRSITMTFTENRSHQSEPGKTRLGRHRHGRRVSRANRGPAQGNHGCQRLFSPDQGQRAGSSERSIAASRA